MTCLSTTGTPPSGAPGPAGALRMTPGRWAALAVAVPVALALIGWTGYNLVGSFARGSYPFSYAVPVQHSQVAVTISAGSVTLRQGPGGTARLTGIVQYGLFRPDIVEDTTPNGVNVGLSCDGINSGNCGMNATLAVPARTAVMLGSNGGDIAASGFSSNVTLSAEGGNVTANDLAGTLTLDSGGGDVIGSGLSGTIQITAEGGDVQIGNVNGPTRVDTGGGDLTASGLASNLTVFAEGGNVDAEALTSAQVVVQSGGGDVTLVFNQPPANLQITAQGGNINVVLPVGSTTYDIATPDTQGGNVNYPAALYSATSHNLITADSGGGDVTITQGGGKFSAP
jgi:phosphotransferase system HPr-like phosphotransfer protein